MKEVDSLALINVQLNLDKDYKNFFRDKPVGFLVSKVRKNLFRVIQQIIKNKFIKVPKLKSLIRIKLHRQLKEIIKSATISCHSSGKYYVSFLCRREISELPYSNSVIGIDLGIMDFAILSNSQKIDNNKFTSKMEKKLKHEQCKLLKRTWLAKKKGINLFMVKNYQKQKMARLHEKVMNQCTTDLIF